MIIIYISGIDGCGKTTQAEMLVERLKSNGHSAEYQWLRWEPSLRKLIGRVRKLAGGAGMPAQKAPADISARSGTDETANAEDAGHGRWTSFKKRLFASTLFRKLWLWHATRDYFASYRNVSTSWQSDYVIMDRYILDFVIDQALNFSLHPADFLAKISGTPIAKMKSPAYSIFIDIPAETGYQRKLDGTPFEYLKERERLYAEMPTGDNVLHIDGTATPESIHASIFDWLSQRLDFKQ